MITEKRLNKQNERINTLLELIKENPNLPIVPMVDYEIVAGDDFGWWLGSWGKAEIDEVYYGDERIYFRSTDEDTLIENVADNLAWLENLSDEEAEEKAENEVKNYKWKKVIVVKIVLP